MGNLVNTKRMQMYL